VRGEGNGEGRVRKGTGMEGGGREDSLSHTRRTAPVPRRLSWHSTVGFGEVGKVALLLVRKAEAVWFGGMGTFSTRLGGERGENLLVRTVR